MSKPITITLPLPPKQLSPNARCHYMSKANAVKKYRTMAFAESLKAQAPGCRMWRYATVQATFYHKQARRRDADNSLSSLKAALDGLADAGVVADDHGFTHKPVLFKKDAANPRVEITVWEDVR